MEQDQVFGAEHLDGVVDLVELAHPGGQDERPPVLPVVAKKVVVGERSRSDLVAGGVERLEEVHRGLVPAGGEPDDAEHLAVLVDGPELLLAELQAPLQLTVRGAEGALAGPLELLRAVDDVDRALLELDGVTTGGDGCGDQLPCQSDVAVVVDTDLGHHEARLGMADASSGDLYRLGHLAPPGSARCRSGRP